MHELSLLVFYHGFKFQDSLCNCCHDLTTSCLNISDIVTIIVKHVDNCSIIHNISKSEDCGYVLKILL